MADGIQIKRNQRLRSKKSKDWRSSYNDPNSTGESGSTSKSGDWRSQYAAERQEAAPREQAEKIDKGETTNKYRGFELTDKTAKKVFGMDVSGFLDKLTGTGHTYKMKLQDKDLELDEKEFLSQFDKLDPEFRKNYVAKLQAVTDKDATARNTLKVLEKNGKFKGNFMDFIEGSNDKLYGGLARGAIRTGAFVTGNKDKAENYINDAMLGGPGEYTSAGKAGEKFGSAQKGVVDVATVVIPAAGASKVASGLSVVDKLSKGGKAAQIAAKVLPNAAGSVAGTAVSAGQDIAEGREKDLVRNAAIGTAADLLLPGVGKVLKYADKAGGKVVADVATAGGKKTASEGIEQIGERGIVGGLNKMFSRGGQKLAYKVGDALSETKAGSKLIDMKDDFMTKWVTDMHPLYKTLKRSDFEGKTSGAYLAAREAIGNSNRALSYAQDFVENDPGMKAVVEGIQAKNPDVVAGRKAFDEYAKVRSEIDLATAGKKQFSEKKLAELNDRLAKAGVDSFDQEYQGLVKFYEDINDFRLENGLISKAQYDQFKEEGFDYVRQQRELPNWMLDKPQGKGMGSKASITKSDAVQKRNKYASAELLSPLETAIKTAQMAHVEAYRNKAAKTLYSLLDEAGEAKLVRSSDMVNEKRALLTELKEGKAVVNKMNRAIRTHKNAAMALKKEITALNRKGRNELSKELRAFVKELDKKAGGKEGIFSVREVTDKLLTMDSVELRKVRRMLESRNAKLEPLLDRIEILNRDLADLSAQRSGMWNQANSIKTTVDKGGMTSLSFLDDGIENVVKVDPAVASAVHNWDKQQQNVMNNFLRMSNNVFKYGTTGLNAGFALPNFVADQVGSAINSKNLLATHNPSNFIHSLFMTIGRPLNAADQDILQQYLKGNKGALNINQYTKKATSEKIANKLARDGASRGSQAYTLIKNPKEGFRTLFRSMEDLIGVTENLTRVQNFRGSYNQAIKEGMEENASRIANQAARENSVDFLEMGTYGRVVNSFIPYFNAAIQGNRVMLRNAAERPVSFAAKSAALIGMPIAASTAWNVSDPDRKAIYDTIPEYVKETNYVIIGPGAKWNEDKGKWDGVFLMKKPPGFKEFAEPIRKFIEYKADDPNADVAGFLRDEGGSVAADFGSTFTPIDFSDPNKFLSSVTPQILKPTAEAITNKNFFTGEDIVPDYMKDQMPQDQKYEHYSQLTSHIAGMFNTSPLKVDQWIRQTFGEVGTNAINTIDRVSGAPDEAVGGRSLGESITRRFYGAPGGADTDAFYKAYNPAQSARTRASKRVTELVKEGKIQEAKRKAEEYNSTVQDRFDSFFKEYGDSPNYDPEWNQRIEELLIPINDRSFSARKRQK
jgi:hypothetical protein